MAALDTRTITNSLGGGAVGFGALALVAPKLLARIYGLPDTGPFRFLFRLWGTRTAALGTLALTVPDKNRRQVAVVVATMNSVDAVTALTAGPDLTRRTRIMAALTSGTFAVGAAAVAADLLP